MKKLITLFLIFISITSFSQNPLLLKDVSPGNNSGTIQHIVKTSNYTFFNENDGGASTDRSLYRTDGTAAGTIKLNLSYPGYISTKADKLTALGNKVIFAGDNFSQYGEIWSSDGTQPGTVALERFQPISNRIPVVEISAMGSYAYYSVINKDAGGINRAYLRRTDGTVAGTSLVYDFSAFTGVPQVVFLTPVNNILYFIVYDADGTGVDQLWRSDGTTAGTYMVYNFTTNFVESFIMPAGNNMYIMIGSIVGGVRQNTIWKSDGTAVGTVPVKLIGTGNTNTYPPFAAIGSTLYFAGLDGNGKELWKTDGTAAGTLMAADINSGGGNSVPSFLTAFNNNLFFAAENPTYGGELWKYDGSVATLVKDINPGNAASVPQGFVVSGNSLIFSALNNTSGRELWTTDGTSANTIMIADINPGANSSSPNIFTPGNPVYFAANNGINGVEVFKYDNNSEGIGGPNKFYVNDNSTTGDLLTLGIGSDINNGSKLYPFATISYAVTQTTEGDTIYVDAGTYAEQITIDKGLTIIGSGQDLTSILKPAVTSAPPGSFFEQGVIQTAQSITGDVHISDLSVTGDPIASVTPIIIQSGGSVKNCKLQNGNQGIFVRIDPTINLASKTFVVDGNTINAEYIAVNFAGTRLTATLSNNTIATFNSGFSTGVFAGTDFGTLTRLTVTGNIFSSYVTDGLFVNTNNGIISQNSFLGTGQKAINKSGGSTINAACNWYGSPLAATVKSKVNAGVIYSPWLINGTDNSVAVGFQTSSTCPVANSFYVNDNNQSGDIYTTAIGSNTNNGSSSAPFATLSYALSQVAANDIIYVDAGNYAEQVIIDKGITIIGAGQNLSSFTPPATPLVPAPGSFTEIGLFETTSGISSVHISNLSINSNGASQNIIIQSGGSVTNCKLLNGGQGIFFRVDPSSPPDPATNLLTRTAVIENNTIEPNGIGINCQGSRLTATIRNNIISNGTGYYAGIFAGLDFGPVPQLTISNNIFTNYFGIGLEVNSNIGNYNNNSFSGTNGAPAIRKSSGNTPNATCNWYGSALATTVTPQIIGTVTYSPWLIDGTDNSPVIGFQSSATCPVANSFYVNDNSQSGDIFTTAIGNDANTGTFNSPFATLSYAISQVPVGATIYVDAGTYATPNLNINKSITIIGANSNASPNNPADRLAINPVRNAEAMITGSTFTISSNDVRLEGLSFNPGAKSQVVMANTGVNNFTFKRNNSIITFGTLLSLAGPSSTPLGQPSAFGNYLIEDNRFESQSIANCTGVSIVAVNDVTVNNNTFITSASTTQRVFIHSQVLNGGLTVNYTYTNNISYASRADLFSTALPASATFDNNITLQCFRSILLQGNIFVSTDIKIRNNYIETDFADGTVSPIHYTCGGTTLPGAIANALIENNTVIQGPGGRSFVPTAILARFSGNIENSLTTIRKNKINFNGNYSLFTNSNVFGIGLFGKLQTVNVEENEIAFTGTNLTNAIPSTDLSASGISISSDFGPTNPLPSNAVMNITGNKISGFRNSIAVYDASNLAPNTYVGYGNLPAGVVVNINNNSFTGDVMSINNGTTGQNVNATCNWYGSSIEQDVFNKITTATVQHIPWLINGTDNDVAVGFQPVAGACNGNPRKLYVNDNSQTGDVFTSAIGSNANLGTQVAPFATLDFALSVAKAGDSIYVDAGTYSPGNFTIDKAITILGTNYSVSPNSIVDPLVYNSSRNTESIISNSQITLAADNINIEGFSFNTPSTLQFTLSSTAVANNLCNNIKIAKNRLVSSTTAITVLSFTGKNNVPLITHSYLFHDNRFENGTAAYLRIFNINGATFSNNTFIRTIAPATNQIAIRLQNRIENLVIENNVFQNWDATVFYGESALTGLIYKNNKAYSCQRCVFISNAIPEPASISITNSLFQQITPSTSDQAIRIIRTAALNALTPNTITVENNILNYDASGAFQNPSSLISVNCNNNPASGDQLSSNFQVYVRKNKITYSGNLSSAINVNPYGLQISGPMAVTSIDSNEVVFTGFNVSAPAPGVLLRPTGIFVNTNLIPAGGSLNINNNIVNGFKHSVAFYNNSTYGGLANGIIANINYNSFTGDSISINNGTTGQTVNASCNWYGSSAEQDVVNKVTSTVQHISWLTNGTDNDVAVGFQPVAGACNGNPRKLYVNDNSQTGDVFTSAIGNNVNPGTQAAPFATLDFALSVAKAGDSIYVDAGTYAMTDYTITKGVTILGSNYNQSPNNPADKLQINPTRNAESIIAGATATLASNDISLQGLMFDPGLKPAISLNNSVGSNNNYGNFSLLKNRFRVVQTSSQVILVGVGVTAASPAPVGVGGLVNTGFTITDNRYEKSAAGAGAIFSIHLVKNVTIDNNSFVLGVGGAIRTAIALSFGVVGVIDNVSVTNNTVDRFASFVTGNQIANGIVTGNRVINTSNAFNLTNTMAGSATIQFSNNILDGSGGIMPFTQYNRQGGSNAGASSLFKAENNTISVTAVPGTTTLLGAFNVTYFNGVLNSSAIIRGNTMTFSGNLSSVEGQFIRPIFFRGNLQNVSIDHNEITLNGTNLQPRNPANPLPVCPAISMYSDNGVTSVMPAGAVINILNNKIHGFKQSFIIFDPLVGSDAYTGFGNLQPGISVNVHENSFTGDSICINNGSVGGSIDASCNWYGYAAIQNLVGRFSTDLNNIYTPYLTNGTDNDVATGFQPVPGSCNGQPVQARLDSYTNVTCNGANNGTINITVFNGVAPYVFTWTKDGNAAFISHQEDPAGLAPGTYHLSITDALGTNIILDANEDIITIDVTITEPPLLTANAGGTNVSCYGGSNGSASVTAGGGTLPYSYLWSNGGTNASISNVAAGIYTVTVTDGNGCTKSASYQVTQPTLLTAVATGTSTACANSATVVASGGTAPYNYSWSNGAITQSITSLPAGTYTVTVTDGHGCQATANCTVSATEAFNPSASVTNVSCFGGNNGAITVTNVNGVGPFQFSLNGVNFSAPSPLPYTFSGLTEGTYTITVKDANGCTGFVDKTVTQPPLLVVTQGSVQNTCSGQSTGSITVTTTGGSGSLSFSWTGPGGYTSTQKNISGLATGNYTLTVTDGKGCSKNLNVTVPVYPLINVSANITNVSCFGSANGSIDLTVTGGTGSGFTYSWNNGVATTQDRFNLAPGTNYKVTITDIGSGCQLQNITYAITQPTVLGLNTVNTSDVNGCISMGIIEVAGTGGTSPYQYKLNYNGSYQPSGLFQGLPGTAAGIIDTVWVKDSKGCTYFKSYTIKDDGKDAYENNNSKNNASAISLGATISARIGASGDIDYFKLSPSNTWIGNYTLSFVQPSVAVVFDLVASNGTTVIVPTSSAAGYKQYNGLNGTYFVRVTGTNSLSCYQLTVTSGLITRSSGSNTQQEVTKTPMKDGLFDVKVLGNPSSTSFIMNVITNSEEKISMRVFDAQGRLIEERQGLQPMETLRIGERYINGVYMAEIRQGKKSKTVRLVKM